MALDAKDRAALDRFVADLEAMHGDALLSVLLVGEAAGPGYRPRRSPLATAVVLAEVSPAALRRTRERTRAWSRRRIPTPLLLDPLYLESSRDVFPLELLDLREQHVVLAGRDDLLRDLPIDAGHLRLEVEEQVRGKMLHLWEAYLEAGPSKRSLRRLLLETPPGFEVILRGMLRLARGGADGDAPEADARLDLAAACEAAFGIELATLRRLAAARGGRERIANDALDAVFESYLAEVRRLVRVVDDL